MSKSKRSRSGWKASKIRKFQAAELRQRRRFEASLAAAGADMAAYRAIRAEKEARAAAREAAA